MNYDFTTVPDRRFTGSFKWRATEPGAEFEGAFPLSTADMEWSAPDEIKKECADFAMNGFYCYTVGDERYLDTVCAFMRRRHDWNVQPEWITTTYGIVSAIHTCVRAFTEEGDGVIIQQPVYGHFEAAVRLNNRKVLNNSLVRKNGSYEINFDELEEMAKQAKLLILCSPHNPTGRVWTREELERIAGICLKNNVTVVSDEIHFDIVSRPHTVFASLSEEVSAITVTCTAPSKSFNIAGLGTSNIIISDPSLREKFRSRIAKDGYECINAFAYPAILTAYTKCDAWLDEMLVHLKSNYEYTKKYFSENMPEIGFTELEGTYLVWLDANCFGVSDEKLVEFFAKEAGVVVNNGGWFGKEGEGFIRLNIAIPETALKEALERIRAAYDRFIK